MRTGATAPAAVIAGASRSSSRCRAGTRTSRALRGRRPAARSGRPYTGAGAGDAARPWPGRALPARSRCKRATFARCVVAARGHSAAAMSTDPRPRLGRRGEALAAEHFERLGGIVLARNHRTRWGELDLVVAL